MAVSRGWLTLSEDARSQKQNLQIIWPWTWYYTLRVLLGDVDDIETWKLVVASLMFWISFDKIGQHPLDDPITQRQLEESNAC